MGFWARQKVGTQTAIIASVSAMSTGLLVAVLTAWLPSRFEAPKLRDELAKARQELADKNAALQRAETEMIPFRVFALQKFDGTEAERVAKLALWLRDLQAGFSSLADEQRATGDKTRRLEDKLSGRALSAEQRLNFGAFARDKPKGKVHILTLSGNSESSRFGDALEAICKEAGFTVSRASAIFSGNFVGMELVIRSLAFPPQHAEGFRDALGVAGINLRLLHTPSVESDTVELRIGSKD